jgi:hypothetical protein
MSRGHGCGAGHRVIGGDQFHGHRLGDDPEMPGAYGAYRTVESLELVIWAPIPLLSALWPTLHSVTCEAVLMRTRLPQRAEADELLTRSPLALLIGMLLDQRIPMEWAFPGPLAIPGRLGRDHNAGARGAPGPGARHLVPPHWTRTRSPNTMRMRSPHSPPGIRRRTVATGRRPARHSTWPPPWPGITMGDRRLSEPAGEGGIRLWLRGAPMPPRSDRHVVLTVWG